MDAEIRRFIESALDEMILDKGDLLEVLKPHMKPLRIRSFREFALGYMVGGARSLATYLLAAREVHIGRMQPLSIEDKLEIEEMIRQRYQVIMERVEREQYK